MKKEESNIVLQGEKESLKKYLSHNWQPFARPHVTGAVPSLARAGASACQKSSSSGRVFTPGD